MALLKFKRSAVSGKAPALADLELGELAINTFDGKVYMRKDNGTASIIEVGGGSGVLSFNSRTGAVTLSSSDVTTALSYTPMRVGGNIGNADLNTITNAGVYRFDIPTANGPGISYGQLLVMYGGADTITQIAGDYATGDLYTRSGNPSNVGGGGAWSSWAKVWDNTNLTNLNQLTNGPGYITGITSGNVTTALGYTPANKAGDTFTGTLTGITGRFQKNQTAGDYTTAALWTESYGSTATGIAFHISGNVGKFLEMRTDQILYWPGTMNASGDYRAPIFYDSNDTSFYLDPNGTSVLNAVNTWGEIGARRNDVQSLLRSYNTSAGQPLQFYLDHSYGNINIGNSRGIVYAGGSYWEIANSVRAPIFYDSNNTAYYLDPASTGISGMINGEMRFGGGGSSSVITSDGDFYSRRKSSTSTGVYYFADGGSKYHYWDGGRYYYGNAGPTDTDVSFRAPIFYDLNDTAYFADPNSTSNLYRLSSYIAARDANANWNTGFQNTPAYSYNYHGDLNGGTNAPAAGWWFYESMRHSNASNYWGTQIAWGWEDNATRLLQRNVSGGGYGSWVEYLNTSNRTYNGNLNMTGSIISTSSDVRAPIFYDQNNTAAYIDPAGASWIKGGFQMNVASPSNDVFGGLEMREAGLVAASQSAATYAPGINFHWGSRAAARLYMAADGNFVLGGQGDITNNRRNLSGAAFYANNWFRSYGTSGWYNETYEGGIWMNDVTWVRVYNSKRFLVDNELAATGNITAYYSDERLKTKIGSIDNALEKLAGLDGFLYVENELARSLGYKNEKQQVGVSAQAVQAVLPEAVSLAPVDFETLEDGTIISKSGENYLTVDYSRIVPLLIEAIKELNNKVETLEASIRSK